MLFLLVDTLVLWRAVNWFNARVPYTSLLPVRASAYILSILNEQVGKGAIALYLNRTRGVPGWQVGSSMLFIMFCEFFYLLSWATLGYALEHERLPAGFRARPLDRRRRPALLRRLRDASSARSACRSARRCASATCCAPSAGAARCTTRRSCCCARPRCSAAFWVYAQAPALFGVEVSVGQMVGLLPAIFVSALLPLPGPAGARAALGACSSPITSRR